MKKTALGSTGLEVSRIGFGGLPIQRLSERNAVATVRHAIDSGMNFIDTATRYGASEQYIGSAIQSYSRDKLIIASRTGVRSYSEVKDKIKASLKSLKTDYIDLYQLHNIATQAVLDQATSKNGAVKALLEAKKAGIVKHIGVSSHHPDIALKVIETGYFETMMFAYNFVVQESSKKVLAACQESNVAFLAMKPLAGGALGEQVDLAIRFLLDIPDIVPVVGLETVAEVDRVIAIERKSLKLTQHEMKLIARKSRQLGTRFCRRCGYCLPCPQGIAIPIMNNLDTLIKRQIHADIFSPGRLLNQIETAHTCSDCAQCEEQCPYDLPIRKIMKRSIKVFEKAKRQYEKEPSSRLK